jgi:hypothetical protein
MRFLCPTCGCERACYHDEHAADEITVIPRNLMAAGLTAALRHVKTLSLAQLETMVEDIHRAMHGREPLKRRTDRDYTESGLERFK